MRRAALVVAVLAVLLLADGLYMELTSYQPGDQNTFTGNPNIILSDGATVLIAGGALAVVSVLMWLIGVRGRTHGTGG